MLRGFGVGFCTCQQRQAFAAGCLALSLSPAWSGDWTQYRGPNHDGISSEHIVTQWPTSGPPQVWKIGVTNGFSSFAISQGRAFTLESRAIGGTAQEVCRALNAETGAELWATALGPAIYDSGGGSTAGGGDGPRSTPSVVGGRVYTMSAYLSLACLNATNGAVIWSRDLRADYGGQIPSWQYAASPLIDGDLVFVNCGSSGGALLGLRTSDGGQVWRGQTDGVTHSTPVVATIHDVRQVIFLTQSGLVAVSPTNGAQLWRHAFGNTTSLAASPVVSGNVVFCSAAYSKGSLAIRVDYANGTFSTTQLWRKTTGQAGFFQSHWMTPVCHEGFLYGMFGYGAYGSAPFMCIDLATGAIKWQTNGFGQGGTLLVDGHLLVLRESGRLALVKPDTNAYTQVASFQAVNGKCWNVPAMADGRIYARSITQAVCLDVSLPALKMFGPRPGPEGWKLLVGTASGAALDADRAARIELHGSANLASNVSDWPIVTNDLVLTNGRLLLSPLPTNKPHRYFIAIEPP